MRQRLTETMRYGSEGQLQNDIGRGWRAHPRAGLGRRCWQASAIALMTLLDAVFSTPSTPAGPSAPTVESAPRANVAAAASRARQCPLHRFGKAPEAPQQVRYRMAADLGASSRCAGAVLSGRCAGHVSINGMVQDELRPSTGGPAQHRRNPLTAPGEFLRAGQRVELSTGWAHRRRHLALCRADKALSEMHQRRS